MRILLTALAFMLSVFLSAQAPALIPYQTVVRDAEGQPLANSTINAMFTIHHGSVTGIEVWQELQTVTTNANGLCTVQLGNSVPFTGVNWSVGAKFLQVELDLGNGFVDMGTQQMVSVPYALQAGSVRVDSSAQGDTLFIGNSSFVIVPGVSGANQFSSGSSFHSCGIDDIHNPLIQYGSMIDQDGNEYKTVIIGEQEWMAENLKVSSYRNGDEIPTSLTDSLWNSTTQGAWCYYDDNENYECPFGKLYNWYAAVDARGICPVGWHVPSDEDWSMLVDSLGNYSLVGVMLKSMGTLEQGTGLWRSPNQNANNSTGFSGLPGGYRNRVSNWGAKDGYGYYWSASLNAEGNPLYRYLSFNNFFVYRHYSELNTGFSVRCVRD